jgi:transcriptional regulator with XRE-family HTH domain
LSALIAHVNNFLERAQIPLRDTQAMLAQRIRGARIAAGLTQSALARLCNVTPSAINKLEKRDTKSLSGELLLSLSSALKVSASWLDTGLGSPAPALRVSIDEGEIISIFRKLSEPHREALLSMSKALLSSQIAAAAPAERSSKKLTVSE